jgi:hypothetical protein
MIDCGERRQEWLIKFLLTSAGIRARSDGLVDLLGKPIAESSALCIPTAILPFPAGLPWPIGSSAD